MFLMKLKPLSNISWTRMSSTGGVNWVSDSDQEKYIDQMRSSGVAMLENFVTPEFLQQALSEVSLAFPTAFHMQNVHTILQAEPDPRFPDHPLHMPMLSGVEVLSGKCLGPSSVLRRLYSDPRFLRLVTAITMQPRLFPLSDPLGDINVFDYLPGGPGTGWHLDESPFSTTLLLRAPGEGGEFELVRNIRVEGSDEATGVAAMPFLKDSRENPGLLRGTNTDSKFADHPCRVIGAKAGTLLVFDGRTALHRIMPITKAPSRIVTVFAFGDKPGARNSTEVHQLMYGETI